MKKYFLLSVLIVSSLSAQELIQVPSVPTSAEIDRAVAPPKVDCDSCKELPHNLTDKIVKQVSDIKREFQCNKGRERLKNDVTYFIKGGAISDTKIGGSWQPGFVSGTISELYVGVGAYKDLMFVSKVTDNGKLVGYNVTLSMCELPNAYPNLPALISNDRPLSNFQAPYGIMLNSNASCGYGVVSGAFNTMLVSQKNPKDSYTTDFPVYTSFAQPSCAH